MAGSLIASGHRLLCLLFLLLVYTVDYVLPNVLISASWRIVWVGTGFGIIMPGTWPVVPLSSCHSEGILRKPFCMQQLAKYPTVFVLALEIRKGTVPCSTGEWMLCIFGRPEFRSVNLCWLQTSSGSGTT